jgi:hypothetical protein
LRAANQTEIGIVGIRGDESGFFEFPFPVKVFAGLFERNCASMEELEDLQPGMVLQGIVTNVTHFGKSRVFANRWRRCKLTA